jgi:hypothetical protein
MLDLEDPAGLQALVVTTKIQRNMLLSKGSQPLLDTSSEMNAVYSFDGRPNVFVISVLNHFEWVPNLHVFVFIAQ